ncbi:antiviral reverse transcriptase Drt3a [Pseudomonas piscis]|uniref:Antiviral reverse transcriptase Drt3a n=1 Tax=Pseudomonas piscis TaxID=2614538 RepID=A0ABY9NGK7_9PSED|nr:antiviral reverse transcriptase Drt3a [Pseudomonas piscis]WMN16622.1 antiviral reverse transcriptase Drt3a [Pseudomonas piscis]
MSIDQAFSIKNLNKLLDEDREKGGDLEERYIPDAYDLRTRIYELKKSRSLVRYKYRTGLVTAEFYELRSGRLNKVIKGRKESHSILVDNALQKVSRQILSKNFRVELNVLPAPIRNKTVYGVGRDLAQILAIRFVQKILKEVYHIEMPPRDILVAQVKSLAMDGAPKFILRADVESFYESVQHKDLLESIHQSPQLSVLVKRIITRLLGDYLKLSGTDRGLPRGVGISAYLSEIYLAYIDTEVKRHNEVFYYARYVDDMIMMFAPAKKETANEYLVSFGALLAKKGLSLNDKTQELNLMDEQRGKFTYLGYEFDVSPSSRGVRMSIAKVKKYRERIEKSFKDYQAKMAFIPRKAARELITRSLFLTGNMRLFNRKSNAFIGIYYSNKHITELSQLRGLDRLFQAKTNLLTDPTLKRKLSRLSFENGFVKKEFRSFSTKKLSEISRGWKHA